jgi:hypothetical protein
MSIQHKNPSELEKLIPLDLGALYELGNLKDMEAELEANGWLVPGTLSKDGIPIDCYRRLKVAVKLGIKKVPVIISELDATVENRVALNHAREKTWRDKRTDLLVSFETFGLKQGQKATTLVAYDRYDEIRKRTGCRFKDDKTIRDVEWILKNDVEGFPMAYWLLEKNVAVGVLKQIMEINNAEYSEILKDVKMLYLNPKTALQKIENAELLKKPYEGSFILPESAQKVEIFNGEKEDLLLKLKDEEIKTLFYHIDPMPRDFEAKGKDTELLIIRLMNYSTKHSFLIKDFITTRLNKRGNVFVSLSEYYDGSGFAQQMSSLIIAAIEKENDLIYKQTIYITRKSLTSKEAKYQLVDGIDMMLWFVRSGGVSFNIPKLLINEGDMKGVDEKSYAFKTCSNYLDGELYQNFIKSSNLPSGKDFPKEDGSKYAFDNPAAFLPIKLTTRPGDLVVDLSMKHDVAQVSTLLNRRYIGYSSDKKTFNKVKTKVGAVINAKVGKSVSLKITDPGNISTSKSSVGRRSRAAKKTNNSI